MEEEPLRPIRRAMCTWLGTAKRLEPRREKQDGRSGSRNPTTMDRRLLPSRPPGATQPARADAVACRCLSTPKESYACCIAPPLKTYIEIFTCSHHRIVGAVSRVESCTP